MNEVMESYRRCGRVQDWSMIGVGAVSAIALFGAGALYAWTFSAWLSTAVPAAMIVAGVVAALVAQRCAVNRHDRVCADVERRGAWL